MEKITITIVMALLCLFFRVEAQPAKAFDVTSKGLKIGHYLPEVTFKKVYNFHTETAKISDFKGKLLILDFWATWCSPCLAMLPKIDSLQKQFGDQVQFLSVTYQQEKEVLPFLERYEKIAGKHYEIAQVMGDKELHKLFPHHTLPHFIWIDRNGMVKAITEDKAVSAENIQDMLRGKTELKRKQDLQIAYNPQKPYLINGNGGDGSNLLYHSVLTRYQEGLKLGYTFTPIGSKDNEFRITARNIDLLQLYCIAYGGHYNFLGLNRVILECRDSTRLISKETGKSYLYWLSKNNGFCYELILPLKPDTNSFKFMQEDLSRFFPGYAVHTENRSVKCLVLKRSSKQNKLHTSGGTTEIEFSGQGCKIRNSFLEALTTRLEIMYMQNSKYPIVNGTGYKGRVDMDIDANLSSLEELNKQLVKYDLEFVLEDYPTYVLVIRDKIT